MFVNKLRISFVNTHTIDQRKHKPTGELMEWIVIKYLKDTSINQSKASADIEVGTLCLEWDTVK